MDEIYGVSLDLLAEFMAKQSELQAKFGDADAKPHLEQWALSQGKDSNTFWQAYQVWHERFRADPTGQLYARFTMKSAELAQKVHFGDVRNMSEDTQEGVTLDRYAQITVAMGKPGADAEAIARQYGLTDAAHWVRVNAAWSQVMSQDFEHKLSTQFGALYQKYAGPAFTEGLMQQTAAIIAESNQPRDRVDEPSVPETADTLRQKLSSPSQKERWGAAQRLVHMIDIGTAVGANYRAACVPVLIEILERHDEYTASDAENAARRLLDIGERTEDVHGAMARCLNRAEEKLATVKAAFAPIQNSAVPERNVLQSRIQAYTSLVSSLRQYLADFGEIGAPVSAARPRVIAETAARKRSFAVPLVLGLVAVGGVAAFFLTRGGGAASSSLSAALPAADSASTATATTPVAPATATATAVAAETATAAPSAGKPAHAGKPHHQKKK